MLSHGNQKTWGKVKIKRMYVDSDIVNLEREKTTLANVKNMTNALEMPASGLDVGFLSFFSIMT